MPAITLKCDLAICLALLTLLVPWGATRAQDPRNPSERFARPGRAAVALERLDVGWLDDDRLTYSKQVDGRKVYVIVNAATGERSESKDGKDVPRSRRRRGRRGNRSRRNRGNRGPRSPDGERLIKESEHELWMSIPPSDKGIRLTQDGTEKRPYRFSSWAPDSKTFLAWRETVGDDRRVHYVESSPKDQLQPKLHSYRYAKPGDAVTVRKPLLFTRDKKRIEVDDALFENPYRISNVRWQDGGDRLTFEFNQRGHAVYRVVEIDARTGKARALIDESTKTFFDYTRKRFRHDIDGGREIIWMSERDGWNHLWLYDGKEGAVKNQITSGAWVVRSVERVDEASRRIWFWGSGRNRGEDPYHRHLYRVGFDGKGVVALTDGDGTHSVQWSPQRRWLVDTWSRVDAPPVHVLRDGETGRKIQDLERADVSKLLAGGWRPPERFVAKGRDGKTDIWGILHRPRDFDPKKRYPVIEHIYAGPHDSFVPKSWRSRYGNLRTLADLGFVVVQIDGMGTSNRSRAFHHFCHKNLGDAGIPDRIAWMKSAAKKRPWLDLSRVGIFGTSAGAQSALGALLDHPGFYKAAAASCGCHDNRMDKIWWNEMWMGWPIGPHYAEQSNVTKAPKLQGKLLLIVGETDHNVDPASTMQVVAALVKANKDFDLIVLPGQGHSDGGRYGRRRTRDFFVRHLLGK